jgi:hypothetical protein
VLHKNAKRLQVSVLPGSANLPAKEEQTCECKESRADLPDGCEHRPKRGVRVGHFPVELLEPLAVG